MDNKNKYLLGGIVAAIAVVAVVSSKKKSTPTIEIINDGTQPGVQLPNQPGTFTPGIVYVPNSNLDWSLITPNLNPVLTPYN